MTNIARTTGYLGAISRAAATPALTQSTEEVEAIDVLRAIDALRGDSHVKSDTTYPDKREMARNTAGTTLAVLGAVFGPKIGMRAAYGYEADTGSLTPDSDEIAQGAFTVEVFDKDPAGTPGFDGHAGLTFIWIPSQDAVPNATPATPTRVHLAVGGGISWTRGRFTVTVEAPAAANLFYDGDTGWDAEEGVVITAALSFGNATTKALSWGERDGAHLTTDSIVLRGELSKTPSIRLEAKVVDLSLALNEGDSVPAVVQQGAEDQLRPRRRVGQGRPAPRRRAVRQEDRHRRQCVGATAEPVGADCVTTRSGGARPLRARRRCPAFDSPTPTGGGLPVGLSSGGMEVELPARLTRFGPFRIQKNRVALGRRPDGRDGTSLELSTSVDAKIGPVDARRSTASA